MSALILALAMFSNPIPEPAYFKIEVETNTLVSISIKGQEIKQGQWYKTEPLSVSVCVEVEIAYVSGGEVRKRSFWLDIDPGERCIFRITLYTQPPLVLVC